LLVLLSALSCSQEDRQLRMELQKSFNTYIRAMQNLDDDTLKGVVLFSKVRDYKGHVMELLRSYQEQLYEDGSIDFFDQQGVVLCRFLGLGHHRYQVMTVERLANSPLVRMRISVHFAYDNTIASGGFEPGTVVFIPREPWGSAYRVVLGQPGELPRKQLRYCEIVCEFHPTNLAGYWQLRRCEVDPNSPVFEESFRSL
jgi:hypothetical protein